MTDWLFEIKRLYWHYIQCLSLESHIPYIRAVRCCCGVQQYFENLDPLGQLSDKDFVDYLYSKSLEIEPRNQKPPKFVSRWATFTADILLISMSLLQIYMLTAPRHWALDTVWFLEQTTPFTLDQIWGHQTAQTSGLLQDLGCHPAASLLVASA